ncbi:hypothetical protein GCM10010353_14130 [Streptomyces chryseus]|nr:hypothetical protein GCM10010353_14130 [Streptomyces chryseus]
MTGTLPPLGRCQHCGQRRALSTHRSVRHGLPRLLCTSCYSNACLAEEAGHCVDFRQAFEHATDDELTRWLGSAL